MGKEQGKNICTPAGHTVAGKTLSHCQLLMKKRKAANKGNVDRKVMCVYVCVCEFLVNVLVMTCLATG